MSNQTTDEPLDESPPEQSPWIDHLLVSIPLVFIMSIAFIVMMVGTTMILNSLPVHSGGTTERLTGFIYMMAGGLVFRASIRFDTR